MSTTFNSKSLGIVMQMEQKRYSDLEEENMERHFLNTKEAILLGFLEEMHRKGVGRKNEIEEIVIGHEHGSEKRKCHMQLFIKFAGKIRTNIKPGEFCVKGETILYITQRARKPTALRNYCKKGGDFLEYFPGKQIKDILHEKGILSAIEDNDDPYDVLFSHENLSEAQVRDVFKSCPVTEFKKDFFTHSDKIINTYNRFFRNDTEVPDFKWNFPGYMLEYIDNHNIDKDRKAKVFNEMYIWFKQYCEPEGTFRRKALFLFSLSGGLGKSYFARRLVPEISICNSPYYVYCRGSLDAAEFLRKSKTARLVILDDVNYIGNDMEIWKALSVSEPTNIRSPYHNTPWLKSLPCVLLSNNTKTLKYWLETEDLQTRCVFIGLDFYIGPPGTDSEENHRVDSLLSEDIKEFLYLDPKSNKCSSF